MTQYRHYITSHDIITNKTLISVPYFLKSKVHQFILLLTLKTKIYIHSTISSTDVLADTSNRHYSFKNYFSYFIVNRILL